MKKSCYKHESLFGGAVGMLEVRAQIKHTSLNYKFQITYVFPCMEHILQKNLLRNYLIL